MLQIDRIIGGVLDTNGYHLTDQKHHILIDAPAGAAKWLAERQIHPDALWLTHTHFDHVLDAAAIQKTYGCPLLCHPAGESMLRDPSLLKSFGFNLDFQPAIPDRLVTETDNLVLGSIPFSILHVPGHSRDSICFYAASEGQLFGGDVLFAGGVGRWDLPGGDGPLLLHGIQTKLYPLPASTRVHPGHGPSTTIGEERAHNPYTAPTPGRPGSLRGA